MLYTYFPKWVGDKGMLWGVLAIIASAIFFSGRIMPFYLYVFFVVEVIVFFSYSKSLSHSWSKLSTKAFIKKIFWFSVILRALWTLYNHFQNVSLYGTMYYTHLLDMDVYIGMPYEAVQFIIERGDWSLFNYWLDWISFDDLGAPIFNTILFLLTGNSNPCLVVLIGYIFMGAYTTVFTYRIAQRHFGEDVARITALFCMLNPNLIWWCGSLMKETQMTFFTFWFLDRMDAAVIERKLSADKIIPIALIGMFVFLYRAALGVLLFLAFFATLVFISNRFVNVGKKIFAGIIVSLVLLLGFGEQMREQTEAMLSNIENAGQKTNMEWRSEREHGNKFATYASAAVFAPIIFTIPFPTISYTHEGQIPQMEVAGGNFIKNILSFFVILSMFMLLLSGEWKQHVFPIAYLLGYLLILVLSAYAQSGRFHVPVLPVEMMFAAYGIKCIEQGKVLIKGITKRSTYKKWFNLWCVAMFAACIFWQWYKLKGQGII